MSRTDDRLEQISGYGQMSEKEMAHYFDGKDDVDISGSNLPKPPKKGEFIICQACGQPIYPRQKKFLENESLPKILIMSSNKHDAKREYQFHIHHACREARLKEADMMTPGLMAERKETEELLKGER